MPRILSVDDDEPVLRSRDRVLRSAGYETVCAVDGKSGLEAFVSEEVHLVLLDYSLPDTNGKEVAQRMRAIKPAVPIVMLSGQPQRPEGLGDAVDVYLVKGLDVHELLANIHQLIQNKRPVAQARSLGEKRTA